MEDHTSPRSIVLREICAPLTLSVHVWKPTQRPTLVGKDFNSSPQDKMADDMADDIFNCIFLSENGRIPIQISLMYVPRIRID